ncbi:MAG: dienelactone hydrolase family protein [Saprospiraceae bacterium]
MLQRIFLFSILSFFLFSCGETPPQEKDSTEKFAENATDKDFQDKHETPKEIDFQPKGVKLEVPTLDGKMATGYLLTSKEESKNYLFVFHEWYGLNDHIKRESERLHQELPNTNVIAIDLYDGQVASKPEDAGKLMQSISTDRAKAIIEGFMASVGKDARIATIGWCFGGGWSLQSSIMLKKQGIGCVIYYGSPIENAADLLPLEADILGLFAKKDTWISPEKVEKFHALTKATGKNFNYKIFDADHAFANPSGDRYEEAAAQEANAMALEFLKKRL